MNKILIGDCLIKLKEIEDNSVDSIVTDPPYELGFMGKSWDNTGIANNKEMWADCLRVLKPGGHLLAFSGTRTYHRMACAIEDAGFEVRDMIEWVYGSGFPKSLNVQKQLEKIGRDKYAEFQGVGTALKPAHEPICMARKPLSEKTVTENCLKWGTGGINIDESRVDGKTEIHSNGKRSMYGGNSLLESKTHNDKTEIKDYGRFPANLIHDNSEEVRECFPDAKGWSSQNHNNFNPYGGNALNESETTREGFHEGYNDSGNASRFFKSIIYNAKASKSERNKGCEELEEKEEVYPGINTFDENGNRLRANGSVIPPLKSKNNHPTVKPIALMEYLIKMVTPKGGIVLDPFAGSGSTLVAAKQNGFQYIGIEITEEYIPIINARLKIKTNEIRRNND